MQVIKYKAGYKYQLAEDYSCPTSVIPTQGVENEYISLSPEGVLAIKKGYAWDGPSGPTMDTPSFMRGALHHDALYQLMRENLLPLDLRKQADVELRDVCREDGMLRVRAWWVYRAVRMFGHRSATSKGGREVITCP